MKILAGSLLILSIVTVGIVFKNYTNQSLSAQHTKNKKIPVPTQVYERMQDEHGFEERKDNYMNLIHGNHPDWRKINEENFENIYLQRKNMRANKTPESFANGLIQGEWIERGSNNLAGNVQVSDFDTLTETLYAIADGGILWKGDLAGTDWEPLNEDIQFGSRVLKSIYLPDNTHRIVAARGHGIFYSDDEGATWTQAAGFSSSWSYGTAVDLVQLNDANKTLVYLYNAYNFGIANWQNRLAYSSNNGDTWNTVLFFNTNNSNYCSLDAPFGSSRAYIVNGSDESYYFEGTTLTPVSSTLGLGGSENCYLTVNQNSTDTTLYVLIDNEQLFKSTDGGLNYNFVATTPVTSWDAGIEVSIDNSNVLYLGEMELWRSTDGGLTFNKVNEWWEYYDDVDTKIHADIMSISSFKKTNGDEFTIIPNHGGISISDDLLLTTENIGINNLNVGQLYDVLTSPINSNYSFLGSQDQGFQKSFSSNLLTTSSYEQLISGDYGQMQFTNNGQSMFIQYPGADFSYYSDVINIDWSEYWFNVDGDDMANYDWIVPTAPPSNPAHDYIYMGGGNVSGGPGSYLIKLINMGSTADTYQYNFDFLAESGATISAIGTTPADYNRIYVGTANGKFYYSEDEGVNWNMSTLNSGPEDDWIFGASICVSKIDADIVYFGGSGYGNEAVYKSTDGGETFSGIWPSSLPETAVRDMCFDPSEKYLFAATDAGPYVYIVEEDEWYSMLGLSAPVQEYTAVEFVASEYVVRFATWGRGIWDFKMVDFTSVVENNAAENFSVYPNPSSGELNFSSNQSGQLAVFDLQGKLLFNTPVTNTQTTLNLSHVEKGNYVIVFVSSTGVRKSFSWVKV